MFLILSTLVSLFFDVGKSHTHKVVEESGALSQYGSVVGKGLLVDVGAVGVVMTAVVHLPVFVVDVLNVPQPVPCLLCSLGICFIVRVSRQPGPDVEETAVSDGFLGQYPSLVSFYLGLTVLIVVTNVPAWNLPSHATTANIVMSIWMRHLIPYSLCQSQPLKLILWRIREPIFRS